MISKFAHFKSIAMSSPFLAAFEEQKSLQANYKEPAGAQQADQQQSEVKGELKIVRYREEEAIFIQASHDRVTVIFSTVFKEETDRVYGRVFLQASWPASESRRELTCRSLSTRDGCTACRMRRRSCTRTASLLSKSGTCQGSRTARTGDMSPSVSVVDPVFIPTSAV